MHAHRFLTLLLLACAVCTAGTPSQTTVFKSVGRDGRIVYGDRPPADGAASNALKIAVSPSSPLSAETLAYIEHLKQIGDSAAAAAAVGQVTLFTTSWCKFCKQAKAYLAEKHLPFREIDVETPAGAAAYARAGGTRGVPLLVANGKRVAGFSTGSYDALFGAAR